MSLALARGVVAHIDAITPRRAGEPTLAQRLARRPFDWLERPLGLLFMAAIAAVCIASRLWSL